MALDTEVNVNQITLCRCVSQSIKGRMAAHRQKYVLPCAGLQARCEAAGEVNRLGQARCMAGAVGHAGLTSATILSAHFIHRRFRGAGKCAC
jgi:hypothetical protein